MGGEPLSLRGRELRGEKRTYPPILRVRGLQSSLGGRRRKGLELIYFMGGVRVKLLIILKRTVWDPSQEGEILGSFQGEENSE